MDNGFDFFRMTMPPSRPAAYCLGCLGGSVYLDFGLAGGDRIHLIRMSFDGYGCCNLKRVAWPMDGTDSAAFIEMMDKKIIDQTQLTEIIKRTISKNRDLLWEDALEEYGFI